MATFWKYKRLRMKNVILDGEWKAPGRGSGGLDGALAQREG